MFTSCHWLEPWSHAAAGDNFHWLLTEWGSSTPLGVQRWPPQTSSPPGHRWALSLTGDAGTIRDRATGDPGQSTKKVQSAWMKVIREEAKSGSTRILHYWSWCLLSIIKVVNCRIGNVSQANLQLPRDTITGSLAQLPLDNIGIGHY